MKESIIAGVAFEGQDVDPLDISIVSYLVNLGKEMPFMDYKETLEVSKGGAFAKIVKDIFAFSNYGGGYLVIGVKQNDRKDPKVKSKFIACGLPEDFISIDDAALHEKFNAYSNYQLPLRYHEFDIPIDGSLRKFGVMYIPPAPVTLIPTKDADYKEGDKNRTSARKDVIYIRQGTRSIPACEEDKEFIKKRCEDTEYRLSILSGEPDDVKEPLFSNLFEIVDYPENVFIAEPLSTDYGVLGELLKSRLPGQYNLYFKFKVWNKMLITLEDITDPAHPYRALIKPNSIEQDSVKRWIGEQSLRNLILELLRRSLLHRYQDAGISLDDKLTRKLFFRAYQDRQFVSWSKNIRPGKKVFGAVSEPGIGKVVWHSALRIGVVEIDGKLFYQLSPTFLISEDGINPISNDRVGIIITKFTSKMHNGIFLNNLLFWVELLSKGASTVDVSSGIFMSSKPVTFVTDKGIKWDKPATLRLEDFFSVAVEYGDDEDEVTAPIDN